MALDVAYVRAAIPPGIPTAIRHSVDSSLYWLSILEEREEGDPRLIEAQKHALMATIGVYQLVAETAARAEERERALRKAQERIYYAVDWRHEWKDEALKQAWRDIEETLGDAAPSSPEGVR